ncbi:MAG: hypothetical protein CMH98_04765 [Oceanospirillaceae bacterium]|nr:hypothetical protein [Oceanospirillaceae bacterium]
MYLEFDVEVDIPAKFSKLANISSISLPQDVGIGNQFGNWVIPGDLTMSASDGPAVALGEGNAVMNCVESIQYTINGCSVSHANWDLFKRSLDTCDIPSDVAQRCFSKCGGAFNRHDEVCTSGVLDQGQRDAGHVASGCVSTAGMTTDTGTQLRLRNFADSCIAAGIPAGLALTSGHTHTVKVLCPLDGAVFNQVYGEAGVSRTSIYPKLALAIPNANSVSVTILFKELEKSLIRRLGRIYSVAAVMDGAAQQSPMPFAVRFKGTEAFLHTKYLRLQAFRAYPDASSLACMRTQVYQQQMLQNVQDTIVTESAVQAVKYTDGGFVGPYLLPSGPDFAAAAAPQVGGSLAARAARIWTCEFQNCQFAQPPTYLFFVAQKQFEQMTYANPDSRVEVESLAANTAGIAGIVNNVAATGRFVRSHYRNVIQNQDCNLSLMRFKLIVQSSVGTFEMSSDKFPYLVDQVQLFEIHKRNCCQDYLKEAGMDAWNRKASCLKLATADYLHGLGTSYGTAFPITISATLEFQNRSTLITGLKYSDARSTGPICFTEPIAAKAAMVGIFDKQVLQIASASAVLSAQNYTASTTSSLISRRS